MQQPEQRSATRSRMREILLGSGVVVVGLCARALVDKMLALHASRDLVAHWAQLQSVFELVAGVALSGIGHGITVYASRHNQDPVSLLRSGLFWGLSLSGLVAIALLSGMTTLNEVVHRELLQGTELTSWAIAAGWLSVLSGLFYAYWLGRKWRGRMLLLMTAIWTPMALASLGLFGAPSLLLLVRVQLATHALLACGLVLSFNWRGAAKRKPGGAKLYTYLPAGLSIGILSPASQAWSRAEIASRLSWGDVSQLQALWRTSEWITLLSANILMLIFLPRFSVSASTTGLRSELFRAWLIIALPAGVALAGIWVFQPVLLQQLYDTRFIMPAGASALFLLGDTLRVASWVLLMALFATEKVTAIAIGEWLSLPLFALLITLFPLTSLEAVGYYYLLTYAIYLSFNIFCLRRTLFTSS